MTSSVTKRLEGLRALMRQRHIDAWIVPSSDPHQSEYVAPHWQVRAWLSGFQGSAGTLVVTQDVAGLWTDPRYHIRAVQETENSSITVFKQGLPGVPHPFDWLADALAEGAQVGFDPETLSIHEVDRLKKALSAKAIHFDIQSGFIATLWQNRPSIPQSLTMIHKDHYAGESTGQKLKRLRAYLETLKVDSCLVTTVDDIAWLLNLRGSDVPFNPVNIAYLLVEQHKANLFIHLDKLTPVVQEYLRSHALTVQPYGSVYGHLASLPATSRMVIDPQKTNYRLFTTLEHCQLEHQVSYISYMKALKNPIQIQGFHDAHLLDGIALVKWLYWLDTTELSEHTEISIARQLEDFKRRCSSYQGPSFSSIIAYKANSATGHYQASETTTPRLQAEGILLFDTGSHYLTGTTDITRSICLGKPHLWEQQVYTTVLKSLITLSTTVFPKGTTGKQLDAIARHYLWQQYWDCRHGIGHGVGHFLNVHEGPQRFSKTDETVFEPGMISSNEPGVYFENQFGVRLENLLLTVNKGSREFGEFYGFETLSLCPFDLQLIKSEWLSAEERQWLNAYHTKVYDKLSPHLDASECQWLKQKSSLI